MKNIIQTIRINKNSKELAKYKEECLAEQLQFLAKKYGFKIINNK